MTNIQAFILGLVQGLAEFLPISSSGHLVLFQRLFGLDEGVITFDIALHFATLIPVIIVLRKEILEILKKPFGKLPLLILTAIIPTFIMGVFFKDMFDKLVVSGRSLGLGFIFTGLVLMYAESVKNRNKGIEKTKYTDALFIGIAQGIAILPAVSRSGLTIAGGLFRGLNKEFAMKISFLISVPVILGAATKDAYDIFKDGNMAGLGIDLLPLIIGMVTAGIAGYAAIKFMLNLFSKVSLKYFSYYVFVLGGIVLVDQLFFGKFFGRLF